MWRVSWGHRLPGPLQPWKRWKCELTLFKAPSKGGQDKAQEPTMSSSNFCSIFAKAQDLNVDAWLLDNA